MRLAFSRSQLFPGHDASAPNVVQIRIDDCTAWIPDEKGRPLLLVASTSGLVAFRVKDDGLAESKD